MWVSRKAREGRMELGISLLPGERPEAGTGCFPFPRMVRLWENLSWLDSEKTVCWKLTLLWRTECSRRISVWLLFPLPCQEQEGTFFWSLLGGPDRSPGGNTLKSVVTTPGWPSLPWSFYLSDLSTLSLQQFVNYISEFPTWILVPLEVSAPGILQ